MAELFASLSSFVKRRGATAGSAEGGLTLTSPQTERLIGFLAQVAAWRRSVSNLIDLAVLLGLTGGAAQVALDNPDAVLAPITRLAVSSACPRPLHTAGSLALLWNPRVTSSSYRYPRCLYLDGFLYTVSNMRGLQKIG